MQVRKQSVDLSQFPLRIFGDQGISRSMAQAAIDGYSNQFRHMARDASRALISLTVSDVVKMYGARKEIESFGKEFAERFFAECQVAILKNFGHFGPKDIREAYRLWGSGQLNIGGAGEMWAGEFSVRQLLAVLGAYNAKRQKAVGIYLKHIAEQKEKAEQAEKADRLRQNFEQRFLSRIEAAKQDPHFTWQDVPAYWYNAAMDRGMIEFKEGEASAIFKQALELAKKEIQAEKDDTGDVFERASLLRALEGQTNKIDERAKVIARKISVIQKVIKL